MVDVLLAMILVLAMGWFKCGCKTCGVCTGTCPSGSAATKSIEIEGVLDDPASGDGDCPECEGSTLNATHVVTFLDNSTPSIFVDYLGRTLESSCHWQSDLIPTCIVDSGGPVQKYVLLKMYIVKFTNGQYAIVIEPWEVIGFLSGPVAAFVEFYASAIGDDPPCGAATSENIPFQSQQTTFLRHCDYSAALFELNSA